MGGYGSGRHGYRPIVEYAVKLDSYNLQRKGILSTKTIGFVYHPLSWVNTSTGESDGSIGFSANYQTDQMTLTYTCKVRGEEHQVKEVISLYRQKTNFGGSRFLFLCTGCGKRTAKLYLPSGGIYFRCRRCYNLTYFSSNESHKGEALLAHIASQAGCTLSEIKRVLKQR